MNDPHDGGEVLDYGLIADIPKSKELFEQKAQFHWDFYSELAYLRNQIYDALKTSLREVAAPFEFFSVATRSKVQVQPCAAKHQGKSRGPRGSVQYRCN